MKTSFYPILATLWLSLSFVSHSHSQSISYTNPEDLSVCDSATFSLVIQNPESFTLTDGTLTLSLNDCMTYSSGSISGATELDVSDPQMPVFQLDDIPPSGNLPVSITQVAGCDCVDLINNATPFSNSIDVAFANGNASLNTDLYEVETPLLVITNVTNAYLAGQKGDVLVRSFTVRNTRFGPLSSFVMMDSYQPGIHVTNQQGTIIEDSPGYLELELGASDFQQIGDGDALFEFNESITIVEQIEVLDCGIPSFSSLSQIEFAWGCFDLVCQDEVQSAVVEIEPFDALPDLQFEPYSTPPYCFCGPDGHLHGMTITNTGDGDALDLELIINQLDAAIDANSVMVDSSGNTYSLPATGSANANFNENICTFPNPVFHSVSFTLPILGAGESVFIHWNSYWCQLEACSFPVSSWEYRFGYFQECPEGAYITVPDFIPVSESSEFLVTGVVSDPDCQVPLQDDSICEYDYLVSHDTLDISEGTLVIDFDLPCGYIWQTLDAPQLAGVDPDVFEINSNMGFSNIHLEYDLPLPLDSAGFSFELLFDCDLLCDTMPLVLDSVITSCDKYLTCNPPTPPEIGFNVITSLQICAPDPINCSHQSCLSLVQPYACEPTDTILTYPSGFYDFTNESRRYNYGLADNDNDFFPDPGGMLDMNAVATDRFLPGDTIETIVSGIVVADETGATFDEAIFDLIYNIPELDPSLNGPLISPEGISYISGVLSIFDLSTGTNYSCELDEMPNSYEMFNTIHHVIVLDLGDGTVCDLPPGFELEHGDSLSLTALSRINVNPINETGLPAALVNFTVGSISRIVSDDPNISTIACGCDLDAFELSGYAYQFTNGVFVVPPCDTSIFLGANFLNFSLAEPDFFPFEYRWGAIYNYMEIYPAPGFELVESRVSRVQWQNGVPFKVNEPISPGPIPDGWYFQLDSCQVPAMDEGFSVLTQHRFVRDCQLDGAYPLYSQTEIAFNPGLVEDVNPLMLGDTANSLRALNPGIDLISPLPVYTSYDNKFRWELIIENIVNSIASQSSDIAYNVWMIPESPSGLVTDFVLEDIDNGGTIPLVNGIFQLGDMDPEEIRNLRLVGTNVGCGSDFVEVRYGWNCEELQSPDEEPCFQNTLLLEGLSPDGELEMQVFSPTSPCVFLCDTVPYHTIEIFNANLGAICGLELLAYIPEGFTILPGSCEMSYPEGSGFEPIPDPQDLGNGQYLWDFDTFSDSLLQNCLAGIPLEPSNTVQIRFLGMTDCDFTLNSSMLFVASGFQTCDDPSNDILRESDPFCIETNAPDAQAFINANIEEVVCSDESQLEIALLLDAETVVGDSIEVVLPPAVFYVPGSYSPVSNGPSGEPLIGFYGTSQVLTWGLPEGLPASTVVSFTIEVEGFLQQECGELIALFRATRQTNALCVSSGEDCSVSFELGSTFLSIQIDRPVYNITAFSIEASPNGPDLLVNYNLTIENVGAVYVQDLALQFLLDANGDGAPTGGDPLVFGDLIPDFPGSGTYTGSFSIPADALCDLMVYVDPDLHCVCSGDYAFAEAGIDLFPIDDAVICSNDMLEIGWCDTELETTWADDTWLNCPDCCPAIFQYQNTGMNPAVFEMLQELTDNEGCEITAHYPITVLPEPGILFADTVICLGDSANLLATANADYFWTGPGILDPLLQSQTVSPLTPSWYVLSITDPEGCSNTDSVFVNVLPVPEADAGADTTACNGTALQLEAAFDPDWTYSWSPAGILSDAGVYNPIVLAEADTTIVLTVTNSAMCTSVDSIIIDFEPSPDLMVPEDQILCEGLADTLMVSGADSYTWTPAVDCLDPECSTVVVNPTDDTAYQIVGLNASGCTDTSLVTITVIDESIVNTEAEEICSGESIDIFGVLVDSPGTYCDTTILAGGCLDISCVELTVNPDMVTSLTAAICPGDSLVLGGEVLTEAGSYELELQTWQGCDSLVNLDLSIYETEALSLAPGDQTVFSGQTVDLEVMGGSGNYTYDWSDPDLLSCGDCPDPTTLPIEGEQEFFVTLTDENGCTQVLSIRFDIVSECDALAEKVPNAFSPNGDGLNDTFFIPDVDFVPGGVEMEIWNRWGQLVLRDTSDDPSWDGMHNGKPAPQDTYVYRIFVECSNEDMVELTGEVQLLR
ncbi:MAG: gliding motility-associated C-terminal domain-containing protein [Bacteroidetes bacterium]|nr:gliding motility-associated C-terminal domain-containing protein [Bacteroidota bacterium]